MTPSKESIAITPTEAGIDFESEGPPHPDQHYMEPAGRIIVVDGVEYKAYTLEEYKTVAHIFVDYHFLWMYSLNLELEIQSLTKDLSLTARQVQYWKDSTDVQAKRGDMWRGEYNKQLSLRQKIEAKQRAFNWIPWTLLAVESLAIGVIGMYSGFASAE